MSSQTLTYPKRLIEVDLPIKKISEHARREKSIRHGHISTLHVWWARRPLAACRAVICASLWPDPADPLCPNEFIETARKVMDRFWNQQKVEKRDLKDPIKLRLALLDFITEFTNWDNSTREEYLNPARELTQIGHESLSGEKDTRPLIVDPFAGGGSIPLEALRVGADVYASDLNPVAVLLNKVVLEYIPKFGSQLPDEVRKWGLWVKEETNKEVSEFYPKDPDGSIPIAYLWARTIKCEGPGCGAQIPLIKSLWLSKIKKSNKKVGLRIITDNDLKTINFEIINEAIEDQISKGTVQRGTASCPCCGYTTSATSVKRQLKSRNGGANDAKLLCIVTRKDGQKGRFFRIPSQSDIDAFNKANIYLESLEKKWKGKYSLTPDEPTPQGGGRGAGRALSQKQYGMDKWSDLFNKRQLITMLSLSNNIKRLSNFETTYSNPELLSIVQICLCLALDRQADHGNSLCAWNPSGPKLQHLFSRAAIPIVWDYAEAAPFGDSVGDWMHAIENVLIGIHVRQL